MLTLIEYVDVREEVLLQSSSLILKKVNNMDEELDDWWNM